MLGLSGVCQVINIKIGFPLVLNIPDSSRTLSIAGEIQGAGTVNSAIKSGTIGNSRGSAIETKHTINGNIGDIAGHRIASQGQIAIVTAENQLDVVFIDNRGIFKADSTGSITAIHIGVNRSHIGTCFKGHSFNCI